MRPVCSHVSMLPPLTGPMLPCREKMQRSRLGQQKSEFLVPASLQPTESEEHARLTPRQLCAKIVHRWLVQEWRWAGEDWILW